MVALKNSAKIKVMVVDDHPAFREGLARLLQEEADLEVLAQPGNGEDAIDLALKLKPDVIIMDVFLPGITGIEAVKKIKARDPEIAILIVSAYNYLSYLITALTAGAAGYLLKNTPLPELVKAIRMVHSGKAVFDMKLVGNLLHRIATNKSESLKPLDELHPREQQVLSLVAKGISNREIGILLNISESTIQSHLGNIYRKLQVNSRTEAVLQGLSQGWLAPSDLSDK